MTEGYDIGIGGFVEPLPLDDQFLAEIAKMDDRTAERGQAQFQEGSKYRGARAHKRIFRHVTS
jgi:hypothetical protein